MIAYNVSLGRSLKLGQVAYAAPYPPGGLEWGQGWGRFAPSAPKIVLPRSPEAGGGVAYTSEGAVLSEQDIAEIHAAGGAPSGGAAAAQVQGEGAQASSSSNFSVAAAGVAAVAILTSLIA